MSLHTESSQRQIDWRSLTELMVDRSQRHPNRAVATFLHESGETQTITYGELNRRSRAVAAGLVPCTSPGDRALLLFPPGLEFLVGFFAASYAGLVPVPTCYPKPGRAMPRLDAAAADCQPTVLIADRETLDGLDFKRLHAAVAKTHLIATDDATADQFDPMTIDHSAEALGLLQYTSGSTSDPKGVMVRNTNLLSNLESIRSSYALEFVADNASEHVRGVFWLPAYHDMGLIGGILEPIYVGGEAILMSPRSFLQRPLRWLQAISSHRASISGAPNFAYQLCVDRIDPEHTRGLDLSCWTTAFCGAEPVRAATLDAFIQRFEPTGYRGSSFCPCYGLAEATLLAAGGGDRNEPKYLEVDRDSLAMGQYQPAAQGAAEATVRRLVSNGPAADGMRMVIVDPVTCQPQSDGQVGEIWLQGPSVAQGYWNSPDVNREQFQGIVAGDAGAGHFLRTGDLGFMHAGRLYVTGRVKDVIILRGRNVYPQDVEATVQECLGNERGGQAVAFATQGDGQESLVVVAEVARHTPTESFAGLVRKLRRRLIEQHEVDARSIALTRRGGVPLTTSGKVQRQACRSQFFSGELKTMHRWDRSILLGGNVEVPELPTTITRDDLPAVSAAIEGWLLEWLAARGNPENGTPDRDKPLADYGLDSLATMELAGDIEDWLGLELTPTLAWDYPTPAVLAPHLAENLLETGPDESAREH
ncbi:Long-chain-fatty-acid--AMP ligase FadD29 [Rosistilla carotiformis]|uniref:Long-chain-fatty-acid--AMP ligase FadD29 n=1 Tax=Rosistilla carotiformis TaxID=2528017 RepID=A0A518K233_9BACT|nr:AMP-binding protein [Rosistilla carotiformis]QDV71829.1 Long-chain-fatty-acid--AMP ligase FadD29 [Rosistilla carotiformis]